jgi:DNA (cytosine-5)-methyltransferase 1
VRIISLFSGAGGLDLGFEKSGFQTVWANEYDKSIWNTYRRNFPKTTLDTRSISDIPSDEIPETTGIIGGPPCQSWSEAGALRGIEDQRGQLFLEYVRVLRDKQPKFFLAENVSGMLFGRHSDAFQNILRLFEDAGYKVSFKLLNVKDFGIPQDRKRVIFVGYHESIGKRFEFPSALEKRRTLKDSIGDLPEPMMAKEKNHANPPSGLPLPNHEFMTGGFSTMFMSRNRVRDWDQQSFTIQAGGRHAPIHPQAPRMTKQSKDKHLFVEGSEHLYRRMSVRECARVQTFPDEFVFEYDRVSDGYKMVGNAVPVEFARILGQSIAADMDESQFVVPDILEPAKKGQRVDNLVVSGA